MSMDRSDATDVESLIKDAHRALANEDYRGAIGRLRAAVNTLPTHVPAWNDLGVVYWTLGRTDEALRALTTALELDPANADTAMNLARVREKLGTPLDGASVLRRALVQGSDDPAVGEMLSSMELTAPRPVAMVAATADRANLIAGALRDAGWIAVPADSRLIGVAGESWAALMEGTAPQLLVVDDDAPAEAALTAAAEALGCPVARIGEDLPDDETLEDALRLRKVGRAVTTPPSDAPLVSVLVRTERGAWPVVDLLDRLHLQDLGPSRFEVVVVDNASPVPVARHLDTRVYPFAVTLLRREQSNVSAAWNEAVANARAETLVLFEDDAQPDPGNLRGHVVAQELAAEPAAILGPFPLHPDHVDSSFRALLQQTSLLVPQPRMQHGMEYGGLSMTSSNISLPRDLVRKVGGFDEQFPIAPAEAAELGYRMEREGGLKVRYDATLGCVHNDRIELSDFIVRQLALGWACHHMWRKHDEPGFIHDQDGLVLDEAFFLGQRLEVESSQDDLIKVAEQLQNVTAAEMRTRSTGAVELIEPLLQHLGKASFTRGLVIAEAGYPQERAVVNEPMASAAVVVLGDDPDALELTLASLAKGVMAVNVPAGLNGAKVPEGLFVAEEPPADLGDATLLVRAGIEVPPDVLPTLVAHLDAWPDIGAVVPQLGEAGEELESATEMTAGLHYYADEADPDVVLFRAEALADATLDTGFDPAAALRSVLAQGLRLRCALDNKAVRGAPELAAV